ncbi:uncharacterized protein LOC112268851 [Brachypodium distachyon]|uniref:uncharacterized protein LOC112268851 n=1 Tax=Brachypodium distachyon TaxID=15368 RepID=UPI000D0DD0D7|nr:uncharacterized protein LOC112268851 [Brachypodium distachyon]|eukprot:XP_024310795.1 uncharacterized protein LOC112268851 [Brachypodium distachyon]
MAKKLPFAHTCGSANKSDKKKGKARMANKNCIADRGKAILQEEATLSAKGLKERLEREYNMKLEYNNVWKGRSRALAALNGTYQENFQLLWNFKAELMVANPGSVCEIDIKTVRKKGGIVHYFNRLFIAFKTCIVGFLEGCGSYLGVDSTFLTGKYT